MASVCQKRRERRGTQRVRKGGEGEVPTKQIMMQARR